MKTGTRQQLQIDRITSVGAYLTDVSASTDISGAAGKTGQAPAEKVPATGASSARTGRVPDKKTHASKNEGVLLPAKEVPKGAEPGTVLDVFLYRDSEDRPIATLRSPKIELGQVEHLTVKQMSKIGAFMDWGLEKDVLLPYAEQTRKVKQGESVLCALYEDKSGRLCVTMNVYPYLRTDSPYLANMEVEGTVYETSNNFGVFVAVDDRYSGLIPKRELYGDVQIGDRVQARVVQVREDGKLTLALRKKAHLQMDDDAALILQKLESAGGTLPYGDKSDADSIKNTFGLSKAAFKRACGRLYKEQKILIRDTSIELK